MEGGSGPRRAGPVESCFNLRFLPSKSRRRNQIVYVVPVWPYPTSGQCSQKAPAAMSSECSGSLQFGAAGLAEGTQRIYRAAVHQRSQLREGLVRRKIRVDDHSNDRLGPFDHGRTRQNTHSAYQGVDADQCRNLGLVVCEGVSVQLRSLVDELLVQLLPLGLGPRDSTGP